MSTIFLTCAWWISLGRLSEPGMVSVKEYVDSPEEKVNIFKKDVNESSLRDGNRQRSLQVDCMRSGSGICTMKLDLFVLIT